MIAAISTFNVKLQTMPLYILIIREDLTRYPIAEQEMKTIVEAHVQWAKALAAKGIFKGGNGIKSYGKLLEQKEGEITEQPLRDAKEGIGGYYMIEVENFEAAVEIAKQMPTYDLGDKVEVRELGA